jgi:hypothetical protein
METMKMRWFFQMALVSILLTACQGAPQTAVLPPAAPTPAPAPTAAPAQPVWAALDYAPAPADNPLKGFMPFYDAYSSVTAPIANRFPHSMEWFYVPLKNLMNGPDSFTFETGLEPQLISIASRGHQAVFRVYLDYPGRPSGIPNFLLDGGLKVRDYAFFGNRPGDSVSPNYDDPKLVAALEHFIAALGKKYDGDPRIGFITVGLVGFWGEWHTWPMDGYTQETSLLKAQADPNEENWMPTDAIQLRILKAFDAAFNQTRLLVRYPVVRTGPQDAAPYRRVTYQSVNLNMGYHDDSFAYETTFGSEWYFMGRMEWRGAINKWKTEPIGGELRPEIQLGIWLDPPRKDAEDFSATVDATHASWLIAHALFTSSTMQPGSPAYERALAGARRLGYEFYVSAAQLADIRAGGPFQVKIRIQNTGVAPFYYRWPVELGVLDASGKLAATWDPAWDLTQILPAEAGTGAIQAELKYTNPAPDLPKGSYTLLMRGVNPLPNGAPLKFANQTQDQDINGWVTLGTFEVKG